MSRPTTNLYDDNDIHLAMWTGFVIGVAFTLLLIVLIKLSILLVEAVW